MTQYEVTVIKGGGGEEHVIRVQATSPDQAKRAAEAIANAEARAQGKDPSFRARQVVSVFK